MISKAGIAIAGIYLMVVLIVSFPLIQEGAIHHGTGIYYLGTLLLTAPLSVLLFWLMDKVFEVEAFHMTGALYYLSMSIFAVCALINAAFIYFVVSKFTRLVQRTPPG